MESIPAAEEILAGKGMHVKKLVKLWQVFTFINASDMKHCRQLLEFLMENELCDTAPGKCVFIRNKHFWSKIHRFQLPTTIKAEWSNTPYRPNPIIPRDEDVPSYLIRVTGEYAY